MIGAALTTALWAAAADGAPLDPSRETAREWARRELSDPVYARARPGWLERAVQWLLEQLQSLRGPSFGVPGIRTGVVLLVLLAAVVALVVLLRRGRLRGPARSGPTGDVFGGAALSAAEHRRLADEASAAGRWSDAVRERYRAVVRSLEERVVIDERPGRTADEAAREAGARLPQLAGALQRGAGVFDDVCYGDRAGTAAHDADLRALDAAVASSRSPLEGDDEATAALAGPPGAR